MESRIFENSCTVRESRERSISVDISERALKDMDETISNFKSGIVSDPIDLSDF